jgi:hypothetical protein
MQAPASTTRDRLRFIAQSRLALALGVSSSACMRDRRWCSASAALADLCRALGWKVRAVPLRAGAEQAAAQVEHACVGVLQLVDARDSELEMRARCDAVRAAVAAVREAMSCVCETRLAS